MNANVLTEVAREAAERGMWKDGDKIVVAVSGGADSMALLHLLHALAGPRRLRIVAAHVNHGFRGEESEAELALVRAYAERLGVPCETAELNLATYIEENRLNLQAAAREKRYAFLHRIAEQYAAASIALAHHADDQAETVMMRIIRGAGLGGLSGIPVKRSENNVELIRPLLRMNKSDLLRYCEEQGIPYCTDSSNLERHYFRNQVRLDILPYLSRFNPQLPLSLQRLAEVAGEEDDFLAGEAGRLFGSIVQADQGEYAVRCNELWGLHVALQRRLIKLILSYLSQDTENISFDGIERMRFAAAPDAPSTWRMDAGSGVRCLREYESMRWLKAPLAGMDRNPGSYSYEIREGMAYLNAESAGWTFMFQWLDPEADGQRKAVSRGEALFDASQLSFPLRIRNRRPGDRIQVLGLNGSKKVQDMFVDEKIPPSGRESYPLLCDAEGRLLWIPGLRRSAHALAGENSRKLLHIKAQGE
ncbi:tRNA lysidine(34) synthetase TilS [Paenibacillus sp. LHD-117]|uniref:tRNA lysidine(34) synthetase TilS n=1 Tax=Paenibacillus sp. LHD-117 TaxID=3071412 RepID=UPI0027DFF9FF|nr:tRNA lysidine(34) synthetase TilS [Paenibacillus sp. LHD-117]MDQ6420714.1 tRNA lysidine(34) synthetase TilS [Paenibacillus sp. LHD-117]